MPSQLMGSFQAFNSAVLAMGKGMFSVQVPKGPKRFSWVFTGWSGNFAIPAGSGELKGQNQQLNQIFCGNSGDTADLWFSARDQKPFPSFFAQDSRKHLVLKLDSGLSGIDLFHFLALCVTLMKELGSLSQHHERTGSKTLRKNTQRYGESVDYWFRKKSEVQIKHILRSQCREGTV